MNLLSEISESSAFNLQFILINGNNNIIFLVPAAAAFLRHIPQPHTSKLMTVILTSGVQWVVSLLQPNWDMLVSFSIPDFNLKR
jgi:hypothetical protein